VVDEADAPLAAAVDACGVQCVVAPTVMHTRREAAALGAVLLDRRAGTTPARAGA